MAEPGSRRSPVMPLTASRSSPVPSPPIRMCRSYAASRIGTLKRTPMPRMKSPLAFPGSWVPSKVIVWTMRNDSPPV